MELSGTRDGGGATARGAVGVRVRKGGEEGRCCQVAGARSARWTVRLWWLSANKQNGVLPGHRQNCNRATTAASRLVLAAERRCLDCLYKFPCRESSAVSVEVAIG